MGDQWSPFFAHTLDFLCVVCYTASINYFIGGTYEAHHEICFGTSFVGGHACIL